MRSLTWVILLFLFILEGSVVPWLIPAAWNSVIVVSPHLVLVVVLFISVYAERHAALIYGLVFGFLQDLIYYGHMLGVHSFSMGLLGYLIGTLIRWRPRKGIFNGLFVILLGVVAYEWLIYGLYFLFSVSRMEASWIFMNRILPSASVNLLFAILIYKPVQNLFKSARKVRESEET